MDMMLLKNQHLRILMLEVGLIVIDLVPENNAIQTDLQKDFNFDSFD